MSNGKELPVQTTGKETEQRFVPTPEQLSKFLSRNSDEIKVELTSVEGRKKLFEDLQAHASDIKKMDPSFSPEELNRRLDLVGSTLKEKDKFMKDAATPEKKGFFRRAWEGIKGFAKNHPIITTVIVIALIAGAAALVAYLSGNMELVAHMLGQRKTDVLPEVIKKFEVLPKADSFLDPYSF